MAAHGGGLARRCHQRAGALEHAHTLILFSQLRYRVIAILLHSGGGESKQPAGLPRMGCEHPVAADQRSGGQQIERIRIHHQRQLAVESEPQQLTTPDVLAEARSDGDDRGASHEQRRIRCCIHGARHDFRQTRQYRTHMPGARGYGHQACAAAQRRLCREPHRAAHTAVAAYHQHMTEVAFMGAARASWQRHVRVTETAGRRFHSCMHRCRHIEIRER